MNNKIFLELAWWLFTIIVVVLALIPVYNATGMDYPFYTINIFLIVTFVTLTRYMFLLKHTFLANIRWLKLVLIFAMIPLFLIAIDGLFDFQDYYDRDEIVYILDHMKPDEAMQSAKYIRYQFLFFGTGAILTLILFPMRMIKSIWRGMNRGSV